MVWHIVSVWLQKHWVILMLNVNRIPMVWTFYGHIDGGAPHQQQPNRDTDWKGHGIPTVDITNARKSETAAMIPRGVFSVLFGPLIIQTVADIRQTSMKKIAQRYVSG